MLEKLSHLQNILTRAVTPENPTGEKGKGAMSENGAAAEAARDLGRGWKVSRYFVLAPGENRVLADVAGMGAVKHIWCTDNSPGCRNLVLRIYWDGAATPSVETPLGDFFASADYRDYAQISSLAVCVNPRKGFNCYWEMPFRKGFRVTLENLHREPVSIYYQIDYELKEIPADCAYFHAQFRRVNPLPYKQVYTVLDNLHAKGHYVGTYLFWGVNNNGWWGEGEMKFYLDGDGEFPTVCGTGTEDYFCGSYNFDIGGRYGEFTTPYSGLAKVSRPDGLYRSQQRFSLYRWHICDPIYFDRDLRVTVQALGWRDGGRYLPLQDDISSVAFWYQQGICDTFPAFPDRDALEII